MQEQGKRLLLACALALGVLLIWQTLSPSKKPPPKVGQGSGSALTTTPTTPRPRARIGRMNLLRLPEAFEPQTALIPRARPWNHRPGFISPLPESFRPQGGSTWPAACWAWRSAPQL
jgi:hypothetical protein